MEMQNSKQIEKALYNRFLSYKTENVLQKIPVANLCRRHRLEFIEAHKHTTEFSFSFKVKL